MVLAGQRWERGWRLEQLESSTSVGQTLLQSHSGPSWGSSQHLAQGTGSALRPPSSHRPLEHLDTQFLEEHPDSLTSSARGFPADFVTQG